MTLTLFGVHRIRWLAEKARARGSKRAHIGGDIDIFVGQIQDEAATTDLWGWADRALNQANTWGIVGCYKAVPPIGASSGVVFCHWADALKFARSFTSKITPL